MATNVIQVDTRGKCFFCLSDTFTSSQTSSILTPNQGFEKLLRYLEIKPNQWFSELLMARHCEGFNEGNSAAIKDCAEVGVTLCFICSLVVEKFHKIYKQYEVIIQQFNDPLQAMHKFIKSAEASSLKERIKSEQLTNRELLNVKFADNLRSDTFMKCSSKLEICSGIPAPKVDSYSLSDLGSANDNHPLAPPTSDVNVQTSSNESVDVPSAFSPVISQIFTINQCQGNFEEIKKPDSFSLTNLPLSASSTVDNEMPSTSISNSYSIKEEASIPAQTLPNDIPINGYNCRNQSNQNEQIDQSLPQSVPFLQMEETMNTDSEEKVLHDPAVVDNVKSPTPPGDIVSHHSHQSCSHCQKRYTNSTTLRQHMLISHPESFIHNHPTISSRIKEKCASDLCKRALTQILSEIHVTKTRQGDKFRKCPYCKTKINDRANLKCHIVGQHTEAFADDVILYENYDIQTKGLDVTGDISINIEDNAESPKPPDTIDLELAPSTSSTAFSLASPRILCVLCESPFPSQVFLDNHMRYESCQTPKRKDVKCDVCEESFASRALLATHKIGHGKISDKCSFCDGYKTFSTSGSLKRHMRDIHFVKMAMREIPRKSEEEVNAVVNKIMGDIKSGDNQNQCPYCEVKKVEFDKFHMLKRHLNEVHFTEMVQNIREEFQKLEGIVKNEAK